jgi:hypothetical protein
MFEFGLFSSQIPYILFVAAYLLYFGASSLNHQNREVPPLSAKVSERHFTSDAGKEGRTFVCKITSRVKSAAEKSAISIKKVSENSFSDTFYPPGNHKLLIHFIGNSVFSRPPPYPSLL